MSRFIKCVLGGVVLVTSVVASGASPAVHALTFDARKSFPVCGKDNAAQEFCIETFEFTPTGGTLRAVIPSLESFGVTASDGLPDVNVIASFPEAYTGPAGKADESGMLTPLSLNFYDRGSNAVGNATTAEGLRNGVYHVVMRTGDYDPSAMMLTGDYVNYSVAQGADGNFTIDLSAKPKPIASVVVMDGNLLPINNCETNNWVGTCAANRASRFYLNTSFLMSSVDSYREAMRGSWIMTNASTVQISTAGMALGQLNMTAKSPHTAPADFGVTGAGEENGKQLNPAFFEAYIPYGMFALMGSQMSNSVVTAAMMKEYFTGPSAEPKKLVSGSISVSASGAKPVDTPQELTITPDSNGVRVNFNLIHFSAPNPSLKLMALKPTVTTKKTATAKAFANYAKLTVAATSTVTLKVSAASKTYCTVVSTKVKGVTTVNLKGLKKGTCKVTVTVTPKKGLPKNSTITLKIT